MTGWGPFLSASPRIKSGMTEKEWFTFSRRIHRTGRPENSPSSARGALALLPRTPNAHIAAANVRPPREGRPLLFPLGEKRHGQCQYDPADAARDQIGRASCRERVCQYV